MILLIDNYDSFAHNLARYFRRLAQHVNVVRNDAITISEIERLAPRTIVMSPGPCTPDQAGICLSLVDHFHSAIPMLGICLGHQTICQALGGAVKRTRPRHGQASKVFHDNHPIFDGVESGFSAARYHSLLVHTESIPEHLQSIARTECGLNMAIAHDTYPVFGFQFHPESILTNCGYRLLANFLKLANIDVSVEQADSLARSERDRHLNPDPDHATSNHAVQKIGVEKSTHPITW